MCKLISYFTNPASEQVRVLKLDDHSGTAKELGLRDTEKPNGWREGHYLPDGEVECRTLDVDKRTSSELVASVKARWPRFVDFLSWCLENGAEVPEAMDLNGLKSAKHLVLPEGCKRF